VITGSQSVDLGLSFFARSGTPINYLGDQFLYGTGVLNILPQGSGGRTPWVYDLDGSLVYTYQLTKDSGLSFGVNIFNLFNWSGETAVDQQYTFIQTLPVITSKGACQGTNPGTGTSDCTGGQLTPAQIASYLQQVKYGPNPYDSTRHIGQPLAASDINPDFKQPAGYQSPRAVRFMARYTF